MKQKRVVLVLGATGMVGQTVYRYLQTCKDVQVLGTARKKSKQFLHFNVQKFSDLGKVLKGIGHVDFIVNCIGITKANQTSQTELITINSLFPHQLAQLCAEKKLHCLHISSDAVFAATTKKCFEESIFSPEDLYGMSKALGEPTAATTLTIRSSFIGFDWYYHTGLFEWLLQQKNRTTNGFAKVTWSGCTTLQFAKLIEVLSDPKVFQSIRSKTRLLHFAPLQTNKYKLLVAASKIFQLATSITKNTSIVSTRSLSSNFEHLLELFRYETELTKALKNLQQFERDQGKL